MSLIQQLEALLFAADSPQTVEALAAVLEKSHIEVAQGLRDLSARLDQDSGLQLIRIAGGYQLATRPAYAEAIAKLTRPAHTKLSRSQLEVLAVVAYRQPVTLAEIELVRGVQSDYGLRQLLEKRLIKEVGRKSAPGRPMLYGTTRHFLHHFHLDDLSELPAVTIEWPSDRRELAAAPTAEPDAPSTPSEAPATDSQSPVLSG